MAELTGTDDQVLISLGPGSPDPSERLRALPQVRSVDRSPEGLRLRVALKSSAGAPVEDTISTVLRSILESGATVGSVARGRSLEDRFLELT
jgi:hypothetical protein